MRRAQARVDSGGGVKAVGRHHRGRVRVPRLVVALALAQIAALLVLAGRISLPGSAEVLQIPSTVDMGEVRLGELCQTVVEVKNRGWQWVRLGTPHTDCDCFSARWDRRSLGPWQSAVLGLELRPPEVPGPFERQVLIGGGTHPSPFRKIIVRGRATAEVWAVPSSVEVELDAQGEGVERVQVFRRLPEPLAGVEPDCPEIAVRCTSADEDALRTDMELVMRAPKDGTGHIQIFTAPHDCALSIPVQRRRRPELIVRPEVLLLSGVASKEGVPQSLGVTLVTKEPHQEVVVRRLVPWLTARSITRVSENALDGELRLTPSKMPRTFSGAGLEASLKEGRTKVSLVAKIAP